MSDTPLIRTTDPIIRAQQWARMTLATLEMTEALETIRTLRPFIQASEGYLKILRLDNLSTWDTRLTLFKSLRQARRNLAIATEACSSLQSELEALQTALQDDED